MKETLSKSKKKERVIIRKCHLCGQVHESSTEIQKCVSCKKSFLPLNYFDKVHGTKAEDYDDNFAESHELTDQDLIKGIFVLW